MDIREYNRAAWDKQVERGNIWTQPVSPPDSKLPLTSPYTSYATMLKSEGSPMSRADSERTKRVEEAVEGLSDETPLGFRNVAF